MFDFFERLTALDIAFIMLWVGAIAYGLTTGIIRQLFMAGATVVGIFLGSAIAPPLSIWTGPISGVGREAILPFTYAVLVFLIALVSYVLIVRSYPTTRILQVRSLDTLGGGVSGFLVGLVIVSEMAAVLTIITRGQWSMLDAVRTTVQAQLLTGPLLPLISATFPLLTETVTRFLPGAG